MERQRAIVMAKAKSAFKNVVHVTETSLHSLKCGFSLLCSLGFPEQL